MTEPPAASPLSDRSLPLFPLGTVLFPEGRLPLRIFEVRYLDMIKKCHRAGREFGVVSLIEGSEVRRAGPGAAERFHAVGTRARIETFAQPQPGLYEIVSRGTTRFRITAQTQTPHGLWMAEVEDIPADAPCALPPELAYVAGNLVKLMDLLRATDIWPAADARHLGDAGWVANRWCELLPLDGEDRQRLMEMRDPLLRLELVGDLLDRTEFGQG